MKLAYLFSQTNYICPPNFSMTSIPCWQRRSRSFSKARQGRARPLSHRSLPDTWLGRQDELNWCNSTRPTPTRTLCRATVPARWKTGNQDSNFRGGRCCELRNLRENSPKPGSGELIVPHLHWQRDSKPSPQLVIEPDASPHRVKRVFLVAVPVQQSAGKCPPCLESQRHGQRIGQGMFITKIEILCLKFHLTDRIAGQGQHLRNTDFRFDEYRQALDVGGADGGAGNERIGVFLVISRLNGD